jgi:predicted PurR-regulated permease PerM
MPIDVRSVSLALLALLALLVSVYMLHWASAVFIPLLLGVMCSYTLSPAVDRMQRWHIPRFCRNSGMRPSEAMGPAADQKASE